MIDHLNHLVLTTANQEACIAFYVGVLGMRLETFDQGRKAFHFGDQKINLHVKGHEFEPKAHTPVPGALDLCFIASIPLDEVIETFKAKGVPIIEGPVKRTGAAFAIRSVYVRDPDLNLIEISERLRLPEPSRRIPVTRLRSVMPPISRGRGMHFVHPLLASIGCSGLEDGRSRTS
jgi:catechol 2,3-dioxygenase-like lactoylglutathione lyase family enzyme